MLGAFQVRQVRPAPLGYVLCLPELGSATYQCYANSRDDTGGSLDLRREDKLRLTLA